MNKSINSSHADGQVQSQFLTTDTPDRILHCKSVPSLFVHDNPTKHQTIESRNTGNMSNTLSEQTTIKQFKEIFTRVKVRDVIKVWKKKVKNSKHRLLILKEWSQTQQSYIKDLQVIINKIEKPLIKNKLITAQQQCILFPNLQAMIQLSSQLLSKINEFITQWHPIKTQVGTSLIYFHKFFKIYREYCNNFYRGQEIIKKIRKQKITKAIQETLPMDFESYLIKPVQRPPKYHLLLREYQKKISKNHLDYANLAIAINKYQEVNEQNNQSMDLQLRNEKMIKLQQKYGELISNTRVFINQFLASIFDIKVKVYFFNDLLLLVKNKNGNNIQLDEIKEVQEIYKKIQLDGAAFVEQTMDGKYFKNRLLICGKNDIAHLIFESKAQCGTWQSTISKAILKLYEKQQERKKIMQEISSKRKMRISITIDIQEKNQMIYRPNFKITVPGVEKRIVSAIDSETFYIIKFQSPYPDTLVQFIYLTWENLINFEQKLKANCKNMWFPPLSEPPKSMGYYEVKKNKTHIIEVRSMLIEVFMNYLFRSEQLIAKVNILNDIKINKSYWKYLTTSFYQRNCSCPICIVVPQLEPFDKFLLYRLKIIEDLRLLHNRTELSIKQTRQTIQLQLSQSESRFFNEETITEGCPHWVFSTMGRVKQQPAQRFKVLQERTLWLDYFFGRIDYSLLRQPSNIQPMKIKVHLLNVLNEDDFVELQIDSQTLVHDVMQQLGIIMGIKSLRDFALCIQYCNTPRLLDRDQNMQILMKQVDSVIVKSQNQEKSNQSSWFSKKFDAIKKWGQQMIVGKKSKLYLRKHIILQPQIQLKAITQNYQRSKLITQQIFYDYQNQLLVLNSRDTKKLCALFYCIMENQRIPYLHESSFQSDKLKKLLPRSKFCLLDSSDFKKQVLEELFIYKKAIMQKVKYGQENRLETFCYQVNQIVSEQMSWISTFFQVINYYPQTIPGQNKEFLLGVNFNDFIIVNPKQLIPIIQIPLEKLDYKITPFSVFVNSNGKNYRFDGKVVMYNIKTIIETYGAYKEKFQKRNTYKSHLAIK